MAQLIDASLCKLQLINIPSLMDVLGRADCKESEILKAAGAAPRVEHHCLMKSMLN